MRRRSLFSLFAAVAVTACAHPVTPEGPSAPVATGPDSRPEMGWAFTESADENKLAFGQPGTDNVVVMLACQPRSGEVLVTLVEHEKRAAGLMTLQAGRTTSKRQAQAQQDMMTRGYLIEAAAPASDPALGRFGAGEALSVRVGAKRTNLPATADGRRFVESCRGA